MRELKVPVENRELDRIREYKKDMGLTNRGIGRKIVDEIVEGGE